MKNPCYKCTDRHFKCHADCEKHKAWLKDYHEKKEANRKATEIGVYFAERKREADKARKKRHSRGG